MGLIEQITISGRPYTTKTITFPSLGTSSIGSDNARFPSSYLLIGATVSHTPTRIRLYSISSSVGVDDARPTSSFNLSQSVGLNAEMYFEGDTKLLEFTPPIIGTSLSEGGNTWYNISSSASNHTVTFTILPLAPAADISTGRQAISTLYPDILNTGYGFAGNITTPKSYILLSGSSDVESRLRLYNVPITQVPATEASRSFGVTPNSGSRLIVDIMFDAPLGSYPIVPMMHGFTWNENTYSEGTGITGMRLQNMSATPTASITVGLGIYSIED